MKTTTVIGTRLRGSSAPTRTHAGLPRSRLEPTLASADVNKGSAAMQLRLCNPESKLALRAFFTRTGFAVEERGGDMLEVTRPDTPDPDLAEREIALQLQIWRLMHPGLAVEIVNH